jgi:hypothetical protein
MGRKFRAKFTHVSPVGISRKGLLSGAILAYVQFFESLHKSAGIAGGIYGVEASSYLSDHVSRISFLV